MKTVWVVVVTVALGAVSTGCGERTGQPTTTAAQPTQVADTPPLPDWAPENPSPEFLRAARVLKPIPREIVGKYVLGDNASAALVGRLLRTYPAAYEFFGTLSDEQIEHFLSAKEIGIPVRSLTARQRAALDSWFEAWRKAIEGASAEFCDYLIFLYKVGAQEDLSNVDVGFATVPVGSSTSETVSTHCVHIWFWVAHPDGTPVECGIAFAQI